MNSAVLVLILVSSSDVFNIEIDIEIFSTGIIGIVSFQKLIGLCNQGVNSLKVRENTRLFCWKTLSQLLFCPDSAIFSKLKKYCQSVCFGVSIFFQTYFVLCFWTNCQPKYIANPKETM